jgi:eukaryotic-like serine/threonine-protein kinase
MPEAAAASSDVGTSFGKYFLMKKLAAGGMGEVFLARQQGPAGFQKVLVVKKILAHLTESKEFVEAFLGEARLAAQMNHRNIVQVFELGEQDGAYFIAMEYVQGKSLRDLIDASVRRKEKIPAELCRALAEQICDGASYAHNLTDLAGRSLNLVHRDLNPQNVLISYGGDVKIIDFGIAKSELSTVKTEAGMIKGKFVYMSPEQSLAKKLDKRSDVFAIGISLYEMLTGINPFHKNNIVLTLEAVQRHDPAPPSEYDPAYAPFDPILSRALAKDRDRRYSDAAEMQDDLRRVVLPRPAERLGPYLCRLFRAQLEEEQQLLIDSDKAKLVGSPPKRTPSRATPPRPSGPPSIATLPDLSGEGGGGGTLLLPNAKAAKAAPAADEAHARPPALPDSPGDTLIDVTDGGPPPRRAAAGEEGPGGTLMLNAGQAALARKPVPRATDAVPDDTEEVTTPEAPGGTQILGASPLAAPKRAPKAPREQASTNILTVEESEEAQRAAQAKLEQAAKGLVRTRTRADKRAELRQARSSRGMWIALGVGTLAAVGLIVGLLFLFFADESAVSGRRLRRGDVPATRATPVAEPPDRPGTTRR